MASAASSDRVDLFGGHRRWNGNDWTASDDRVRGGASTSALEVGEGREEGLATFVGHLDITTLGGAGFASQRTTTEKVFKLGAYDGLEIDVVKADGKKYTLIVKDEILPKRGDGREQSSVSWEYDFVATQGEGEKVFVPWSAFKPTYRGREKKDAKPLKTDDVRRISLMMRSFFGEQEGDFKLQLRSIAAASRGQKHVMDTRSSIESTDVKKTSDVPTKQSWLTWFLGGCTKL